MYKVELFIEGHLIASGEFDIVNSTIPREGSFLDLRETLPWNSWQPSVDEEKALLALAGLMEIDPALAPAAALFPWVQETPRDEALWSLQALDTLAREDLDLAERVIGFSWLADDVTKDEWLTVRALTLLAVRDPAWAKFIADFDWLNDGITEDERWALDALRDITVEDPSLAETLLSLPWLGDQLTEHETKVVVRFRMLLRRDSAIARQVAEMQLMDGPIRKLHAGLIWSLAGLYDAGPNTVSGLSARTWFKDGLDEKEAQVVNDLGNIGWKSQAGALAISNMPFLETLEPADALATKALRGLVYFDSNEFQRIMDHPAISDGITDEETKIVATLKGVSQNSPALVDTLLDPKRVTLEERTIDLPLAGEMMMTIIRTAPGAKRTIDVMEKAVRSVEGFMATPFPLRQIIILFEDAANHSYLGTNFGTHIATHPKVDDGEYTESLALSHFAHEAAHYFWTGNEDWIDEGAASFIELLELSIDTGWSIAPKEDPCAYAANIAGLESLEPEQGSPEFSCNYSLGERLFHDLYRSLDETSFRQGFRNLYLLSLVDDLEDRCEGVKLDICHVEAAFKDDAAAESPAIVDKVIARWYHGTEPYDTSQQDTAPVDPSLPADVRGETTRAYISLDKGRREETQTDSFSASEVQGKVYLTLHFSYPRIQEEREFPYMVIEYFEDGFAYNARSLKTIFQTGWTTSWTWFSLGPSNERSWAPGPYWVYIYHEGRKIAEVEYQVTP